MKLKIERKTCEEANGVAWKGEKKEKKKEKMLPAATDSSAEELSGVFIKKRHATRTSNCAHFTTHTHTHCG